MGPWVRAVSWRFWSFGGFIFTGKRVVFRLGGMGRLRTHGCAALGVSIRTSTVKRTNQATSTNNIEVTYLIQLYQQSYLASEALQPDTDTQTTRKTNDNHDASRTDHLNPTRYSTQTPHTALPTPQTRPSPASPSSPTLSPALSNNTPRPPD